MARTLRLPSPPSRLPPEINIKLRLYGSVEIDGVEYKQLGGKYLIDREGNIHSPPGTQYAPEGRTIRPLADDPRYVIIKLNKRVQRFRIEDLVHTIWNDS